MTLYLSPTRVPFNAAKWEWATSYVFGCIHPRGASRCITFLYLSFRQQAGTVVVGTYLEDVGGGMFWKNFKELSVVQPLTEGMLIDK